MTTVEKRNETLKEEIETKLHVSIHRLSVHRTMTIQSGAHACTEMQLCPSIVQSTPSINIVAIAITTHRGSIGSSIYFVSLGSLV